MTKQRYKYSLYFYTKDRKFYYFYIMMTELIQMKIDSEINRIVEKVLQDMVKDKMFDHDLVNRRDVPESADTLFSLWYGEWCLGFVTCKPRITNSEQYFIDIAFVPKTGLGYLKV